MLVTHSQISAYNLVYSTRSKLPLAQAGVDLATLAAILGHSSIRIVQRYVHPTAEHKRSAMLRYDEILKGEKKQTEQEGRPN